MSAQYTYEQIAADYRLWSEYVDPNATTTEAEFNAMSIEQKIALQTEAFGAEQN